MRRLMAVGAMCLTSIVGLAAPTQVSAASCSAWMDGSIARGFCWASTVSTGQRTRIRVTKPGGLYAYGPWGTPGYATNLYAPGGYNPVMQVCC